MEAFGVALFDDITFPQSGWCSIGGATAIRFERPADLSQEVFWITNVDYINFKNSGLYALSNMRSNSFLRISLLTIADELDIDLDKDIPSGVDVLSRVISRTLSLTKRFFPTIQWGMTLHDSIYSGIDLPDINFTQDIFQREIQSSFQENSVVTGHVWQPGSHNVTLSLNRVDYAELLLSFPAPDLRKGLVEDDNAIGVEEFIGLKHASIARAEVDLSYADNPELLAFGATFSSTATQRLWIAQPEALFLHENGARISIIRTIRSTSSFDLPKLPNEITGSAITRASYTGGLFSISMVYSLMSKQYDWVSAKIGRSRTKYHFPFRAAVLRSVDRAISFKHAKTLLKSGLRVRRYGLGSVTVSAIREDMPLIMKIGADNHFMIIASSELGKNE